MSNSDNRPFLAPSGSQAMKVFFHPHCRPGCLNHGTGQRLVAAGCASRATPSAAPVVARCQASPVIQMIDRRKLNHVRISANITSISIWTATIFANMAHADTLIMSEATFQAVAFLFPDRTTNHQSGVIPIVFLNCVCPKSDCVLYLKNILPRIILARNGAKATQLGSKVPF
jgi:hypothetical protein